MWCENVCVCVCVRVGGGRAGYLLGGSFFFPIFFLGMPAFPSKHTQQQRVAAMAELAAAAGEGMSSSGSSQAAETCVYVYAYACEKEGCEGAVVGRIR